MNIKDRFLNAYKTGGVFEVIRKIFFKIVYDIKSWFSMIYVKISRIKKSAVLSKKRDTRVIVSMTTFPPRLESIYKCLKSLCLQSVKPDEIFVHFGNDVKEQNLSPRILKLKDFGIRFFFHNENIKCHKKYFYTLLSHPNSTIITVDDDVYYPRNWLKKMLRTHDKYPECVCAWRLHKMKQKNGQLLPYNFWIDQFRKETKPSLSLFPTGVGGVLYPVGCFDSHVTDKDVFSKICLEADDVWLKIMYSIQKTKVVWVPNMEVKLRCVERKQKDSLQSKNVGENKNDIFFLNVMSYYHINPSIFFKE